MRMKTIILKATETEAASEILKNGGIVAIPTETVYGLAANTFDEMAVSKIFVAKGRPQDNPLIVHVSKIKDLERLVAKIPEKAVKLTKKFWPGPLTIILKKTNLIPEIVTAGSENVAVRMPSHSCALEIIKKSGVSLAAPSANSSGKPSPTCARHVLEDLAGKIDAVIDGGKCSVGIESTVIDLTCEPSVILRAGPISAEQIFEIIGEVKIDRAVLECLEKNERALCPGTKYKHYAPKTELFIFADNEFYIDFVNSKIDSKSAAFCFDEDLPFIKIPAISFGSYKNPAEQARLLFSALRKLDSLKAERAYSRMPQKCGTSLSVYSRLIRSAAFKICKA
jgi:L-threonylcarbamoyladenylate synthase